MRSKRVGRISRHGKYIRVALMKSTLSFLRVSWFPLRETQCSLLKHGWRGGWSITLWPNNHLEGLQNNSFIRKLAIQILVPSRPMVLLPILFDHHCNIWVVTNDTLLDGVIACLHLFLKFRLYVWVHKYLKHWLAEEELIEAEKIIGDAGCLN